jgi:magnesium transporter
MHRPAHRISKKVGLSPGSAVYVGPERTGRIKVSVIDYDATNLTETMTANPADCAPFRDSPSITWINVDGLHEPGVIEGLGENFGLHPLHVEDIVNSGGRPKSDDAPEYVFVILKMLYLDQNGGDLVVEHVSVVFGRNWVLTFQEPGRDVFDVIRHRIRKTEPRGRLLSTDYLAYSLIDAVVDNYYLVLEDLGDSIEALEDEIAEQAKPESLATIRQLKKKLILLRKAVWPLREVVGNLERMESELIHPPTKPYLRDLYEHSVQVIDTVETYRDMMATMLDLYHTGMSNRLNEIMKMLTIIATIFIPLGFLAGVYGMNFDTGAGALNMPELRWEYGYLLFWAMAACVGGGLLWYFRRKKWL